MRKLQTAPLHRQKLYAQGNGKLCVCLELTITRQGLKARAQRKRRHRLSPRSVSEREKRAAQSFQRVKEQKQINAGKIRASFQKLFGKAFKKLRELCQSLNMDSDKTAIMLLREIHAAVYGNGRAGLQERVTITEQRLTTLERQKTPHVKSYVLKLSIGSGALTSLSNLFHMPEITVPGAIVTGLLSVIWFILDWQEKHG